MPRLPANAERLRIEQGYLPERGSTSQDVDVGAAAPEGRLRRITKPDGSIELEHVIKRGSGLVREEERLPITGEAFDRLWPLTYCRRLTKTRCRGPVDHGPVRRIWEIDEFDDLNLVLAEVELPEAGAEAPIPEWLRPRIVREVTDEKQYRNYELALRLAAEASKRR